MPKCIVQDCENFTRHNKTSILYCIKHQAQIKRNGCLGKKIGDHGLEKIPHAVDQLIIDNANKTDQELIVLLNNAGFVGITKTNIWYRRKKLGIKKYGSGEERRNKEWIRKRAIKAHGHSCELCHYKEIVEVHHILFKKDGGGDEISNLIVVCPNCHDLFTKKVINMTNRAQIPIVKVQVQKIIMDTYKYLFNGEKNVEEK